MTTERNKRETRTEQVNNREIKGNICFDQENQDGMIGERSQGGKRISRGPAHAGFTVGWNNPSCYNVSPLARGKTVSRNLDRLNNLGFT